MSDLQVHEQFSSLPTDLKKEVADFIEFLKYKSRKQTKLKKRQAGLAKGLIKMKDDFDEPLEDFEEYME